MRILDLFSGIGGFTLALDVFEGFQTTKFCDIDVRSRRVLHHRMQHPCTHTKLEAAPIHDDIRTLRCQKHEFDMIVGGFPCFPAGTPVLTDGGYMPIETVTGDEKLLTHTGSWKPIENLQRKLFKDRIASVSLKHHFQPIQCTDNHPFYARTLLNTEPDWVPARDLTSNHYVGLPINGTRFLSDPDQWYMMGVFLGVTANTYSFIDNGYVWYAVTDVTFSQVDKPIWVYNFQVKDDHSYVVQNVVVKNCQGFSANGQRTGVNHTGSQLVHEMARLVGECQPKFVMLENVPYITSYDEYEQICRLFVDHGYRFVWTTARASEFGAPHHRNRWWGLATRADIRPGDVVVRLKSQYTSAVPLYEWDTEPVERMVPRSSDIPARSFLLGNTLVPCVARVAFLSLLTGLRDPYSTLIQQREWTYRVPNKDATSRDNDCGLYDRDTAELRYLRQPHNDLGLKRPRGYVLDPEAYTPHKEVGSTLPQLPTTWPKNFLHTPRTMSRPAQILTMRTKNDLPTQLRFEQQTTNRGGVPNPAYLEWLMGYPPGWTGDGDV